MDKRVKLTHKITSAVAWRALWFSPLDQILQKLLIRQNSLYFIILGDFMSQDLFLSG